MIETHGMHPARVLNLVKAMDGNPRNLKLVACEPETFGPEEEGLMGFSEPVQSAIGPAVEIVEAIVAAILNKEPAPSQEF